MPFISLNKATDPLAPDDLRINTAAVLYVEASGPGLIGQTTIHRAGQGTLVNAVTESIGTVVSHAGRLVAGTRHDLARRLMMVPARFIFHRQTSVMCAPTCHQRRSFGM